jgi:hypothetical protein
MVFRGRGYKSHYHSKITPATSTRSRDLSSLYTMSWALRNRCGIIVTDTTGRGDAACFNSQPIKGPPLPPPGFAPAAHHAPDPTEAEHMGWLEDPETGVRAKPKQEEDLATRIRELRDELDKFNERGMRRTRKCH